MKRVCILLRGINVGGAGSLPMKKLTAILDDLGLERVKTYIQSGNAVFIASKDTPKTLAKEITAAIQAAQGFSPHALVLPAKEWASAIQNNPYPDAEPEPKSLHLWFLDAKPEKPDLQALQALKSENESFELREGIFYLHAPDGIGRSKLAAKVEKLLGVPATARNWRTVTALQAMVHGLEEAV